MNIRHSPTHSLLVMSFPIFSSAYPSSCDFGHQPCQGLKFHELESQLSPMLDGEHWNYLGDYKPSELFRNLHTSNLSVFLPHHIQANSQQPTALLKTP